MALAFDRSRELSRLSGKTTQFRGLLVRDNRSRMQVLESGPQRRVSRRQNTVGLGRRAKFVVFFSVASGTPGRVYQAALAVAACKHKRLCSPRAIWAARIPCLTAYGDGATPGNPASSNLCLAPASWCAGSAIKRPCEPVPVTHAPEGHRPDAKRRVHRSAARLPARPRPAPLVATNSSPGVCSVPTPPSHCISPPVCWRSITPPVAVAGSWECTLAASPGTR